MVVPAAILAEGWDMTIIAGDVFSAFKAAGVDDEMAKRAAAEVGDIKELTQEIKERLGRIETALTYMRWTLGITATGSLATAAGVFALVYKAVIAA
jgi:hypothetical protein